MSSKYVYSQVERYPARAGFTVTGYTALTGLFKRSIRVNRLGFDFQPDGQKRPITEISILKPLNPAVAGNLKPATDQSDKDFCRRFPGATISKMILMRLWTQ